MTTSLPYDPIDDFGKFGGRIRVGIEVWWILKMTKGDGTRLSRLPKAIALGALTGRRDESVR